VTAVLGVISWYWQILCWIASIHIRCFYNSSDISGLGPRHRSFLSVLALASPSASAWLFSGLVNIPAYHWHRQVCNAWRHYQREWLTTDYCSWLWSCVGTRHSVVPRTAAETGARWCLLVIHFTISCISSPAWWCQEPAESGLTHLTYLTDSVKYRITFLVQKTWDWYGVHSCTHLQLCCSDKRAWAKCAVT